MASSLAAKIGGEFLTCDICLESYKDPRGLPCQHGFCRECLEGYVTSSRDKRTLDCPTCRKVVKISKDGVKELPVHFLVNKLKDVVEADKMIKCSNCDDANNEVKVRCLDCKQYLCDTCHASHKHLKIMRNHRVVPIDDVLSGKVNLAEEKSICEEHKQINNYYCKNDMKAVCHDCVILKKCEPNHDRITIDEAAQEKSEDLEDLMKKSDEILKKYQDSVKQVDGVEEELVTNSKIAKDTLAKVEQEYINFVKKTVKRFEDEIDRIKEKRMKELERKKINFNSTMKDIEKVNEDVTKVIQSPYKMEVISSHTTLSTKLKALSKSQPDKVDKTLVYIKFVAAIPPIANVGQLLKDGAAGQQWKPAGQFSTGDFNDLYGLALDEDNNIVVSSWEKGVKVFARNGHVKSTLYNSPGSISVGVLPGKKYVTAPRGTKQIKICDSHGKQVVTCPITNVNNVPSNVNSLTVDSDNKIIVGQVKTTISIHNADGSLISKFATQSEPFRLAVTSNKEIVTSIWDTKLKRGTSVQLLDYSGGNVRVIQPPDEVKVWGPSFVCCGQGEIFVANVGSGDPSGVYRYTSEGDYLGCVTTQVGKPTGIALSRDGMELFVADRGDNRVKILQRP